MQLNKAERSLLKGLMNDNKWDVLVKFINGYMEEWDKVSNITGNNEFEVMREILIKKGKVEGIREILEAADREAFEK